MEVVSLGSCGSAKQGARIDRQRRLSVSVRNGRSIVSVCRGDRDRSTAQIDKAIKVGPRPGHIDTHMGTLFARPDYTQVYLNLAEEYRIPAMAIEMTPETIEKFRKQGYPMSDEIIKVISDYKLPKLDDFHSVPSGDTYEQKKENFFAMVQSMKPGLHEMIFHPSVESEGLKKITNSWQQRVWEAKMFADPSVKNFLKGQGIQFTNWKEIMQRFED